MKLFLIILAYNCCLLASHAASDGYECRIMFKSSASKKAMQAVQIATLDCGFYKEIHPDNTRQHIYKRGGLFNKKTQWSNLEGSKKLLCLALNQDTHLITLSSSDGPNETTFLRKVKSELVKNLGGSVVSVKVGTYKRSYFDFSGN